MNKVISTQDGSGSEVEEYKKSLMESLITDIISKDGDISQAEELERFQSQLSSPNISLSQKINNIMGYQVTLIAPMLMMISDKDLTDKDLRRVRGAEKLFYILDKKFLPVLLRFQDLLIDVIALIPVAKFHILV